MIPILKIKTRGQEGPKITNSRGRSKRAKVRGWSFSFFTSYVITAECVKVKGINFSVSLHFLIITMFTGLSTTITSNVIIKKYLYPPLTKQYSINHEKLFPVI